MVGREPPLSYARRQRLGVPELRLAVAALLYGDAFAREYMGELWTQAILVEGPNRMKSAHRVKSGSTLEVRLGRDDLFSDNFENVARRILLVDHEIRASGPSRGRNEQAVVAKPGHGATDESAE